MNYLMMRAELFSVPGESAGIHRKYQQTGDLPVHISTTALLRDIDSCFIKTFQFSKPKPLHARLFTFHCSFISR
jgi:hypothetical protein